MSEKQYDIIGIRNENGITHQYMDIEGNIQTIPIDKIASSQIGIDKILGKLVSKKQVFLLTEKGIDYIITQADLEKAEFKLYMFLLISNYEKEITNALIKKWDKGRANDILGKNYKSAEKTVTDQAKNKNNLHIAYYLYFSDKLKLIEKFIIPNTMRYLIYDGKIDNISKFRNNIAHNKSLYEDNSIEEIFDIEKQLVKMMKRNCLTIAST